MNTAPGMLALGRMLLFSTALMSRVANRSEQLPANARAGGDIINRIERANSYQAHARPFGKIRGSFASRYQQGQQMP